VGEESLSLQSKPLLEATFPPLADRQALGKVLGMRDEDDTPDDGGDHENDHDHDCEAGSFYEDQYAGDKEAQDARRGSCLLVLLALPAASLLTWLW
jgi:hypothetical protein